MATREPAESLYKDKVEVSLDGRQIFYLFFGGAVIVGLVFVLGVMVGRRVEARSHVDHARTAATADPLAALDNLESGGRPRLSFQGALTGSQPVSDVERQIEELAKARGQKPAAKKPDEKKPDEKKADEKKADEKKPEEKKADKAEAKKVDEDKAAKAKGKEPAEDKPVTKPDQVARKADKAEKADKKPADEATNPDVVTADDKKPAKKSEAKSEDKPRYTLQLSSFQDRGEADAFLSSVKAAGYQAYVTEAEVSGKQYYRVRLGSYRSMDAANEAKSEVEKAIKKSASVMKL